MPFRPEIWPLRVVMYVVEQIRVITVPEGSAMGLTKLAGVVGLGAGGSHFHCVERADTSGCSTFKPNDMEWEA